MVNLHMLRGIRQTQQMADCCCCFRGRQQQECSFVLVQMLTRALLQVSGYLPLWCAYTWFSRCADKFVRVSCMQTLLGTCRRVSSTFQRATPPDMCCSPLGCIRQLCWTNLQ
jgi:hypothetical protein